MVRILVALALSSVLLASCADVVPRLPVQDQAVGGRFLVNFSAQVLREAGWHHLALRSVAAADLHRIGSLLPGPPTTITVTIGDSDQIVAEVGTTGFTDPETGAITVGLDAHWASEPADLTEELARTLAREVDRSVRITQGAGLGRTLLDELVSAGEATNFAEAAFAGPAEPWIHALTATQECSQWRHLAPVLHRVGLHSEVLSGGQVNRAVFGESTMPALTGQAIGYDIVAGYRSRHPGQSWAALARASAHSILQGSGFQPCSGA
ncbi:MAG TPA: DUF2268 domain-containing putative Zn-dependent protease [Candidatus Dormibacteraeota bacterium]